MARQMAARSGAVAQTAAGNALPAARRWVMRIRDLVFAGLGLVLCGPLLLVIGIVIRLDSPGRALFWQERVGFRGKVFRMLKFRTMVDGAEEMRDGLLTHNQADGTLFKISNDPRMTRVGRLLRRFSLDELPQLFNIIRGDMTIVGPRPLPAIDYEFEPPGMADRLAVLPGLTGLWQVSGRSELGTADLIRLDLAYIRQQSLLTDLKIVGKTFAAVLGGKGAY